MVFVRVFHFVQQLQCGCQKFLPAQMCESPSTRVHAKQDADRFWRIPECYVRGNTIKYLRIPDEVIDLVHDNDFGQSNFLFFVLPGFLQWFMNTDACR